MADLYASYAELAANEQIGVEYDLRPVWVPGTSWASIAIHGGGIEPGTSEVAEAVAGSTMRFYEFDAHVTSGSNTDLHVTSANFDEPQCVAMVTNSDRCLSFHGYTGTDGVAETLIGGNDVSLRDRVQRALQAAGFTVTVASSEYPGTDPLNICNRTRLGGGVQLEMSRTLRESMFTNFTRAGRKNLANRTSAFTSYVAAIQSVAPLRGGMVSMGSANVSRWTLLPAPSADMDLTATFATDRLAAGGPQYVALAARWLDASNCYLARVELSETQQVILTLRRRQGGTDTVLGTFTTGLTHAAGSYMSVRLQLAQTTLRAKTWQADMGQPDWQLNAVDSAFTAAGQMGLRYILSSAYSGSLPVTATVRSFAATPLPTFSLASTAANGPWTTEPTEFPLDIKVGGERVTASSIGPAAADVFTRTESNGWGTATSGQAWTTTGGSTSDYGVSGGTGQHVHSGVGVLHHAFIAPGGDRDFTMVTDVTIPVMPSGAAITAWAVVRGVDTSSYYAVQLGISPGGATTLTWFKRVGGSISSLALGVNVGTHAAGATWRISAAISGANLLAKAWIPPAPDPGWQATATDSTITAGAQVGILSRLETGNTNPLPVTLTVDNFTVTNPQSVVLSARGVNGFTRAWPAGTEVDVWEPAVAPL